MLKSYLELDFENVTHLVHSLINRFTKVHYFEINPESFHIFEPNSAFWEVKKLLPGILVLDERFLSFVS